LIQAWGSVFPEYSLNAEIEAIGHGFDLVRIDVCIKLYNKFLAVRLCLTEYGILKGQWPFSGIPKGRALWRNSLVCKPLLAPPIRREFPEGDGFDGVEGEQDLDRAAVFIELHHVFTAGAAGRADAAVGHDGDDF